MLHSYTFTRRLAHAGLIATLACVSISASATTASKRVVAKAAAPSVTERMAPVPDASPEQLQAAERVLVGRYECELGQHVSVAQDDQRPGYFSLRHGSQSWLMKPVQSSSGAVRLEDVRGQTLLIQILTKSMLMDTKNGRRLVDGCRQETQRLAEEDLRRNPRPSMFGLKGDAGY